MNENDIEEALQQVLESKELRKAAKLNKQTAYDLRNPGERIVHIRRKLEILYNAGMLKLNDGTE